MLMYTCFIYPVYAEEDTPVQQPAEETPQPPLIESKPAQIYEPPSEKKITTDAVTEEDVSENSKRTIGSTPQPPLVDPQTEPSYEPEDIGAATEQTGDEPADAVAETEKTPVIEPDKAAEPLETTEQKDAPAKNAETKESIKEQAKKWTETYPVSVNADWLQLKSGEWLRGRITIMQKYSLEFDSDELDDLVIEWENVKYLKSYEPYSLRFESMGYTSIIGVIEVIGDEVHVTTDYDDQTFDRSDLLTIASGKDTEISYWKNKITFSINIRRGNTDQTDFASKMSAKRRTTASRLMLDYLGNFTQVEETETINNHRLNQTFDIFLSRNLFWTPIFSEFFRDPFQNIERRFTTGIGVGYSIIKNNKTEWDISTGPAYQATKFVSVQSGQDQKDSTITLAAGTNFDTELNSKVDLEGLYNVRLGDNETGNYSHHSLLTVETELTDKLDFDVTAVWDYVRDPVTAQTGITPQKSDFRIMIGLGYDL